MNYIFILLLLVNTVLTGFIIWRLLPKKTKASGASVLLDTSAIMDGRIVEVVRSGFVPEQLLIPRFVIAELQLLADKADHMKRERARFGLQVIQDLQDSRYASVSIISDDIASEKGVDEKLVKLALKLPALLFTTDFNLLKVAEIEGVRVLNINELAQNLRTTHVPGEHMELKVVAKGQEKSQGVGYLEDGTMVVIEDAGGKQGQSLKVEFTRTLQTAAGRMMFAKPLKGQAVNETKPNQSNDAKSSLPTQKKSRSRRYRKPQSAEEKLLAAIDSK